jgi:hypothetical protein
MEESTCIQCGWTGTPIQTEDIGSGLEWCCPQCQTWQHAELLGDEKELLGEEVEEQEAVS